MCVMLYKSCENNSFENSLIEETQSNKIEFPEYIRKLLKANISNEYKDKIRKEYMVFEISKNKEYLNKINGKVNKESCEKKALEFFGN